MLASIKTKIARKLSLLLSRSVLRKNPNNQLPSLIYPDIGAPNAFLIDLISESAQLAVNINIEGQNNDLSDASYVNIFPGEHYRLLNAIIKVLNIKNIIEIGTWTGMGSIAILHENPNTKLTSFDVIPWNQLGVPSHLSEKYFKINPNFSQVIADLTDLEQFNKNFELLNNADLIFIDGPKNDVFEYQFLDLLKKLEPRRNRILIIDDIKFLNMIDLWKSIKSPKLDASSFGHWSGTGIVDISNKLEL